MKTVFKFILACTLAVATALASAQTADPQVDGAWARATVQGQKATGAFMKITAKESTRLVGVQSPLAGVAEVHEMKMESDVMKMRAVSGLDLPAGKTVALSPGGFHVMLMDLKAPLAKDSKVPLTLVFKNSKGIESKMELLVPVASVAPDGSAAGAHKH